MTTPNYHGWTESSDHINARLERKDSAHCDRVIEIVAVEYQSERDADRVREIVDGLEEMYTRHPDLFNEQARDAEWLGTRAVISGGEVLEVGPQAGGEMVF